VKRLCELKKYTSSFKKKIFAAFALKKQIENIKKHNHENKNTIQTRRRKRNEFNY
jgi:hypothetical protein